ncbi:FAD-dependent oxidoreductase [Salipiger sp. IMCC34102]|uniref:tRNA (5-methylaminomethyl-2-thiouridine)(34)-methyltransferase MnmD n=1 Tax=Salipiger sp. IMCC34102 TaxID=2510647 RepID=UPI00101C99C2|nr:tRNA (5-methylaminomethyl-2-thiouridine)(34)-methyltransferase MnmD [Salipiger sp. IMCC34102]RYH01369.1 FAD-dependent oxidoreductase [Salipiger sp. IMCC34102]
MSDQSAKVTWKETEAGPVPVSTLFDDPYYSLNGGAAETAHVFLEGNDLPARFREGFHIAELGFGTGLNFLCTLAAWRAARVPGRLRFTSFELHPMTRTDRARALAPFEGVAREILDVEDVRALTGPDFDLRVVIGDVGETLPSWKGTVDAWFLDGFSPARNPAMWTDAVLGCVGARTRPGGTFATYTAAGHVRAALSEAGFDVTRRPGYGRKRHMTTGTKG